MQRCFWLLMFIILGPPTVFAASDYSFTMGVSVAFTWFLQSTSSPDINGGGTNNPTINLIVGKRYAVFNTGAGGHPFQLIAKGSLVADDVILLAEGATAGTLEGDSAIGWTDDGGGNMEFTLTPALATAMQQAGLVPGYRCQVHTSLMRGNIALFNAGTPIADPLPPIAKGPIKVELQDVATSLTAPLGVAFPDGAAGRMLIYQQNGVVTVRQTSGTLLATPFLDVSGRITELGILGPGSYDERGLLGFALHPNFAVNHKVYTHTSEPTAGAADYTVTIPNGETMSHQEVIAEWTVSTTDTNQINPTTRRELLRIDKPQFNHNGGTIHFGKDGMLYIGLGDGGGADDSDGEPYLGGGVTFGHGIGNAQDTTIILGKILRIDVNGSNSTNGQYGIPADNPYVGGGGLKEIYAHGFRNPYGFSVDSVTGSLYIGDVGQNNVEEIDLLTTATKGGNYGWGFKEGTFYFDTNSSQPGRVVTQPARPTPAGLIDPIAQYDHGDGSAVVGGYVYRGSELPALARRYIMADLGGFAAPTGRLFSMSLQTNVIQELQIGVDDRPLGLWVKGFSQDPAGEVYVCASGILGPSGQAGRVLKLIPLPNAGRSWAIYE
jgi:glucose/arabinose dehydrogenase